jgi:hypothetical protein
MSDVFWPILIELTFRMPDFGRDESESAPDSDLYGREEGGRERLISELTSAKELTMNSSVSTWSEKIALSEPCFN